MYFRLNFEAANDHENPMVPPKFDILKKAYNLGLVHRQSLSIYVKRYFFCLTVSFFSVFLHPRNAKQDILKRPQFVAHNFFRT